MFTNGQDAKRNMQLNQQWQARLAEGAHEAQGAVAMRELTLKDRKHRLHALRWAFADWRARQHGKAV